MTEVTSSDSHSVFVPSLLFLLATMVVNRFIPHGNEGLYFDTYI